MLGLSVLFTLLQMVLLFLAMICSRDMVLPQPSLFRTSRLQRLIEELVTTESFSPAQLISYVTIGIETSIFDPSDRKHDKVVRESFFGKKKRKLVPRFVYKPRYIPLSEVEARDGIQLVHTFLALSSTLPLFFPVRRMGDSWIADGGLADNIPIRPLLDCGCTRIFVIHLDATGKDEVDGKSFDVLTREGLLEKLKWQKRLDRLVYYYPRVQPCVQRNGWGGLQEAMSRDPMLNLDQPMRLTAEVIHVVPSRPLGSFVTGTLNFTARKARWLMELGEQDMQCILDHFEDGAQPDL
jgi:hypothetical protein